jgi:hypothetical protein
VLNIIRKAANQSLSKPRLLLSNSVAHANKKVRIFLHKITEKIRYEVQGLTREVSVISVYCDAQDEGCVDEV